MYKETQLDKNIAEMKAWAIGLKTAQTVTCPVCNREFVQYESPIAYDYVSNNVMCVGCEDLIEDARTESKYDFLSEQAEANGMSMEEYMDEMGVE